MFQFFYKTLVNDSVPGKKLQGEEIKRKTHESPFFISIYMGFNEQKRKKRPKRTLHTTNKPQKRKFRLKSLPKMHIM